MPFCGEAFFNVAAQLYGPETGTDLHMGCRRLHRSATLSPVMLRRPSVRRCVTVFAVMVSLLFSQLALAAYACPGVPDSTVMTEMMAAGEPCAGMDMAQPVLCHEHAVAKTLSFEPLKIATPSLPAIVQTLVLPVLLASDVRGLPLAGQPEQRPPPDPVFLTTHRLRV
jgi:hypothetical protein